MSPFADVVLLATDGSGESDRAARMAVELSRNLGSELHVIQVAPLPSPYASPESAVIDPRYRDKIRRRTKEEVDANLEKVVGRLREVGGEVADAHAAIGRPDAEIVKLGEELEAGLIVLGSRGLGGVRRALMGSVSDSVARHAHSSVLVVRE
jgi:nucleotide-binding universal stress UspA family protein